MYNTKLKCNICDIINNKKLENKKGFQISAYDDMLEFLDNSKKENFNYTFDNNYNWLRSSNLPKKSEKKIARVKFPFNFNLNDKFNTFYQPPLSLFNGFDLYPKEINKSAVINCKFIKVISKNDYFAWIIVEIISVLEIHEITNIIKLKNYDEYYKNFIENFIKLKNIQKTLYNEYIYLNWSGQSDIGENIILKNNSLILFNEWGFHYNNIYCDNIYIPQEIIKKILDL